MRNTSHFVVSTDLNAALTLATPRPHLAYQTPLPNTVVQWGCAGPWVLAWGNVAAPRRALPDDAFASAPQGEFAQATGSWFKRRRGP